MNWTDDSTADPIADLRAAAKLIADQPAGLRPSVMIMNSRDYVAYRRFLEWQKQTEMILATLPRWRFITRMVLTRQLHGPLHKRYRPRWWYRLREWNRDRTGWYDKHDDEW